MIVKMRKLTLLCTPAEQEKTLEKLRELGVLHVEHVKPPAGGDLEQTRNHLLYVQRVLDTLKSHPETKPTGKDPDEVVEHVWNLIHREKELQEELQALIHERDRIKPYGDFDPQEVDRLLEAGIHVELYAIPVKATIEIPKSICLCEISRDKNTVYAVAFSKDEINLNAPKVRMPEHSLSYINRHIETTQMAIQENEREFQKYAGDRDLVAGIVQKAKDRVTYLEVLHGMGNESNVIYLKGFYPADRENEIVAAAAECGWGYRLEDVDENDNPPTLLRNPKWVTPIKAVLDIINVLPGYRELDVSALFLIFLSIFFAFIIGDAGYGLLFIALTLLAKLKLKGKKAAQPGLNLMLIMSGATVLFGVLIGNYFGIPIERLPEPLKMLTNPYMTGWTGNTWDSDLAASHIMFICFSIAVVHLAIAHLWQFIRKINSFAALIELGWLFCTVSLYTFVLELVLDVNLYPFIQMIKVPLLSLGAALVALGLLLTRSYIGIITLFLDIISNFVDIISYIRLYAVGAASLSVARAFNEMAASVGFEGIASLGAALILFAGHTLNIILGAMGVMVHGIRLNTLEFSSHAGVEWTGIPYTPFKKMEDNS